MNEPRNDADSFAEGLQTEEVRANIAAAEPVVMDLRDAGFEVDRIGNLAWKYQDYAAAVPVLLRWLPRMQNRNTKMSIVAALGDPCAKPAAAPALMEAFESQQENDRYDFHLKWTMGQALSVVADDSFSDDIIRIVRDKGHGQARGGLVPALGNMKDPRAVDVLIELLDDQEVATDALGPLGKLKAAKARPKIERFLNDPDPWVRREAKRALAKIDRAAEKAKEKAARKPESQRKRGK